ncbi:methyltransferase [Streptomyces sp. NBC_00525]|uniref:methyltransferase n=1 Tax=Streptomyces sp. NBC_00525 TaxID=2903660 RepID=UPI003FCD5F94
MERAYPHLIEAVRSGSPVYRGTGGDAPDFYADVDGDSERAAAFAEAMAPPDRQHRGRPRRGVRLRRVRHGGGRGGGNGTLLRTLLSRPTGLKSTVLDLPGTADVARGRPAEAGLGGRGTAVGGSYFDPLPPGDVYILSSICWTWRARTPCGSCATARPRAHRTHLGGLRGMARGRRGPALRLHARQPVRTRPHRRTAAGQEGAGWARRRGRPLDCAG